MLEMRLFDIYIGHSNFEIWIKERVAKIIEYIPVNVKINRGFKKGEKDLRLKSKTNKLPGGSNLCWKQCQAYESVGTPGKRVQRRD